MGSGVCMTKGRGDKFGKKRVGGSQREPSHTLSKLTSLMRRVASARVRATARATARATGEAWGLAWGEAKGTFLKLTSSLRNSNAPCTPARLIACTHCECGWGLQRACSQPANARAVSQPTRVQSASQRACNQPANARAVSQPTRVQSVDGSATSHSKRGFGRQVQYLCSGLPPHPSQQRCLHTPKGAACKVMNDVA